MKRILAIFALILVLSLTFCWLTPIVALAEGEEEEIGQEEAIEEPAQEAIEEPAAEEPAQEEPAQEEAVAEEPAQQVAENEAPAETVAVAEGEVAAEPEKEPLTEEKAREIVVKAIQDFLGQYMENSMLAKVITWLIDAGVLSALVIIYIRYRKVKNKTIEDVVNVSKEQLSSAAQSTFSDVSNEINPQIIELRIKVMEMQAKVNYMLQAFALSQDRSAQGKIAMLQLISKASDADENTKDILEEIKQEILEESKAVADVEDKVEGDYKPTDINIF